MGNKLPNLGCAAPHTSWNQDLGGFQQLAEGVRRSAPCLPSTLGAKHPGTQRPQSLASSSDRQLRPGAAGDAAPCISPLPFPKGANSPTIKVTMEFTRGEEMLTGSSLGLPQWRWDLNGNPTIAATPCQPQVPSFFLFFFPRKPLALGSNSLTCSTG